ncbi:hypothetical protein NQZ68_041575 [Dissostichus eleginoides]|nr:hypothetical protein NQZ68_041575 [Dissostichus eleginoides]
MGKSPLMCLLLLAPGVPGTFLDVVCREVVSAVVESIWYTGNGYNPVAYIHAFYPTLNRMKNLKSFGKGFLF